MADNTIANAIKFLKGEEKSLPAAKTEGQVYFAYKNVGTAEKPSYTGAIYIDTPIGGTQNRIKMTANADIADKAFNDSAGLNIRDTYLSSLGYTDDGKQTILIKGSGNNQTRIELPIASTTKSGIVTTDAQSFGGTKTFTTINSNNLTVTGSSGFNYSGIKTATESKARPVWFADNSGYGKPVVNTNFTYNPATQTLKVANLSGTADKANKDNAGNDIRSTYISNITINNDIMTITKGSGATSTLSIKDKLYSGDKITTKDDLDKFIETNVFKFGHIGPIEGYNGLEKNDGIILSASWNSSTNYGHQIFVDDSGYALRHRYRREGNWSDWASILDSTNYNSYAPTKAGGGAYGTWDINILGNAASANKLNTNAGSATFPVYFSNGVPVACSTNLAVNITGNAASATKLTSNAGSATQPIYFKDGKPVTTTYSLNATVKAGTSNRVAFYSGNNEISSASSLKYYTATNSKKANQTILRIWGTTYGNDATNMISGKASSLSWNDGGPQIQFSTSEAGSQDGALIFTDHDSAGIGASFHFVSNQSEWSVVSKRFVAKASVIIGQENHTANNQGYNLYVNGTEYINGILTAVGDCAFIAHNKEFNFVPTLKASTSIWFNYRQTGGQPTNDNFIINEYVFGNGANKALASIKDGLFSGAATYVRDSNNNTNNISITYSKAGQASTSWLASWNGYELGSISPSNITAGKATKLATARTITLSGAVTGSVSFDGSTNVTLTTSVNHTHSQYYDSNISRTKNTVLAAPNGADGKAVFRSLVAADIPTLTKSKISDFPTSMPASDVYAWAKASSKPSYSWGEINGKPSTFTPSSHTHNKLDSLGNIKAETGKTSQSTSGLSMQQAYNNGYPVSYGNVLNLNAQGQGQILVSWAGNGSTPASKMYFRGKTDNNAGDWSSWNEVIDSSNYTSYTVTKSGSGASGTWGINISGNAATATILATPRKISLTGDATGSAVFNGGADISISTVTRQTCFVGSDSASSNGWYKVASQTMSGYGDSNIMFAVTSTYSHYYTGIFSLQIRSDNTSIKCPKAEWLVRSGFSADSIKIVISGMTWTMYVNRSVPQYGRIMFEVLTQSSINEKSSGLTMYNTYTKESVTPNATKTSSDGGTVNYANSAGSVAWGNISGKPSSFTPSSHTHSYLPLSGGTMNGTSFITWADSGNWDNNNNNVTFPVSRGGLQWYGQSDYVKLFSQETATDNLELVLQFGDDNSNGLSIRNNGGNETARIEANGNIATASLRVGNGSGSTINFCTNGSTSNPGAKIVAYNDRIEFVFA